MQSNPSQQSGWKRKFLTISAGEAVSLIGSSAVQFALIWWLASETASPMMLAFSGLVAFLPQALLGPFAGVWIDRLRRKTVVIAADLFQGLLAVAFAVWFFAGDPPYWTACVVLGLRAVGTVFQTPAMQALIPSFVPSGELMRVGGVQQFLQSGAFMLGPVVGALLYGALPMPLVLLTDLIGALIASAALAAVKIDEPPRQSGQKTHFVRELAAGWKALTSDRRLCTLLLAVTLSMVFFMPLSSYYPLMTSDYFGLSALYGSIVEFAYALGMLLISLAVSIFGQVKDKLFVAHLGLFGIGATSLLCGLLPYTMRGFWVFAALCMIMGASGNFYGIPTVAYMQESIPGEAQGRVFSLMGSLMSLAMPVGLVVSGPVAETYGVPLWFLISGAAMLLITAVSLLLTRKPD